MSIIAILPKSFSKDFFQSRDVPSWRCYVQLILSQSVASFLFHFRIVGEMSERLIAHFWRQNLFLKTGWLIAYPNSSFLHLLKFGYGVHQLHRGAVTYSCGGKTYGAPVHFFQGMQKLLLRGNYYIWVLKSGKATPKLSQLLKSFNQKSFRLKMSDFLSKDRESSMFYLMKNYLFYFEETVYKFWFAF